MARLIAFNAIFFLLPFGVYAAGCSRRGARSAAANDWPVRTIAYLALGGAALLVVGLVAFTHFTGAAPGSKYVPAQVIDGVLVPGHFE